MWLSDEGKISKMIRNIYRKSKHINFLQKSTPLLRLIQALILYEKPLKRLLKNKVVGISSSGGHLTELQRAIPKNLMESVIYITSKDGRTLESLNTYDHFFISEPNGVKRRYIYNVLQAGVLFFKLRPLVVISTGSGLTIPFLLICKFFGSKIIFVESGARIFSTSKSGKFIYKYADIFIVQYENLLKFYPKAIVASLK
jgi:beta-1,4-N-acetylglucosaminyltransferase